jgi:hypothetical protein
MDAERAEEQKRQRPELWVAAAWAVLALEFALAIYLGMKRPGVGPIRAYVQGPILLLLLALLVGASGLVRSSFRRPFLRPQRLVAFCVLGFVVATATYPLPFPSYRGDKPSTVHVGMPAAGAWTVAWGGEDPRFSMRTRPDRCFGFLLVRAVEGRTRAKPDDPLSAHAFGETVIAPCAGKVVSVVEDRPDTGAGPDDLGNHVVLEIARDEYLFLGGLAQGSVEPEIGAQVTQGTPLARVGFSAASLIVPEPHLAIHVQSSPAPFEGQGVPFYFFGCSIDGHPVQRGVPSGQGLFVGHPVTGQTIETSGRSP